MSIDAQRYGNSYIMDNYLIGYFNIVEEAPICFIFKDLDDASIASIKMRAYTYGHKFISDRIIRGCDFIFRIDCRYDPTLRDIPALIHTHMCHTIIHANSAKKNDILYNRQVDVLSKKIQIQKKLMKLLGQFVKVLINLLL